MSVTTYLVIAFVTYGILLILSEITNQWYERTSYIRVFHSAIFWPITLVIIMAALVVHIWELTTQRKIQ